MSERSERTNETGLSPRSGDPTEVPTTHENPTRRRVDGLVIVNTGDGKGKSTAAFGTVMRAVARGWKVAVIQYIKSGNWHVGEEKVCRDQLGVDWWAIGEGFTWESEELDEDQMVARVAWDHTKAVLAAGDHQLVVLDEITYPINWGWIEVDDVVAAIAGRSAKVNVVITGRDAPAPLVELADTVTEMRKVKHAYDTGVMAKKGIDY